MKKRSLVYSVGRKKCLFNNFLQTKKLCNLDIQFFYFKFYDHPLAHSMECAIMAIWLNAL